MSYPTLRLLSTSWRGRSNVKGVADFGTKGYGQNRQLYEAGW